MITKTLTALNKLYIEIHFERVKFEREERKRERRG